MMGNLTFILSLVVILLIQRSLSLFSSPQTHAHVNNGLTPTTVTRGGRAELQRTFSIDPSTRRRIGCRIHYIHKSNLSCGQVIPSVFPCSYEGAVYYQHFGCLGDKELVTLQLSVVLDGSPKVNNSQQTVNVQVFSIELQIQDSEIFRDIRLIKVNSSCSEIDSRVPLRLVFPNHLIGNCHYEVVHNFEYLRLLSNGGISIEPNTVLPCGFMPSTLEYKQNDNTRAKDYILLRIYSYSGTKTVPFYTLIAINGPSRNSSTMAELERSQSNLSIQQVVNTPVAADNFIVDTVEIFGVRPIKYRVEVHPRIGSFHTVQSTDVNVSFTEFSREELADGCVSFYPHYNAHGGPPVMFRYSAIFDVGESVSVDGVVVVTVDAIDWKWPAQRTNNPLQVFKGKVASIDACTIDFYLLDECESQATLQLSVPPQHGHLLHKNGSAVSPDGIYNVKAVRNGVVLAYEHSGDDAMYDQIIWQVKCSDGPSMNVSMAVLVVQTDNSVLHCMNSSELLVYKDRSQPLSISNFGIVDSSSTFEIDVLRLDGMLLKLHSQPFNTFSWLFPFVEQSSINQSLAVNRFSSMELQQQLIWYIPPEGALHDVVDFKLVNPSTNQASSMCSISITISQRLFNQTLFISTTESYPSIQTSSMTLPSTQIVYITSNYLYTSLPPLSDGSINYLLSKPLEFGNLCILSNETCETSVSQFTQQDINKQQLFFVPSPNFTQEIISMEVTVNGIRSYPPNFVRLRIELVEEELNLNKKSTTLYWVRAGKEKRIRARHFPVYPRGTRFRVTQGTAYGRLSYRDGTERDLTEFTRRDLLSNKVWYMHDPSATFACSDSFEFDIISEDEAQTKTSSFLIVIRQRREVLDVNITNRPYHYINSNRFLVSKQSFQISTSFCPEFVVFNVDLPPCLGVLSLIDVENNLVLQLGTNSTFTAKDVYSGLLHYTLFNPSSIVNKIADKFILSASDPVSNWPSEHERLVGTGHILVHIVTSDGVERLDFKITSPRPVSWLSEQRLYGAILAQNDIDITNSTVSPEAVNIQVHLNFDYNYQIRLVDLSSVSVFTLADVYSGQIMFSKRIFQPNAFEDTVKFDVLVEIDSQYGPNTYRGGTYSLSFVWTFADIYINATTVSEETGVVTFLIRRCGPHLWFESRLLFKTYSGSAIGTNCSESEETGFDFCHVTKLIVFEPNATDYVVTVKLIDDKVAELNEMFTVELSQPEKIVFTDSMRMEHYGSRTDTITIDDHSDYAIVRFVGDAISEGYPCQLQLRNVDEGINILAINISRRRNTHDRVGILCRTEPRVAIEGSDFVRRNSVVWFDPNQTVATCNVSIINDKLFESSELFRVVLESVENGRALPDQHFSEMCVFIAVDINDEPEVSFNATEIVVYESETHDVHGHFAILRKGPDLTSRTVLQYSYDPLSSATATYGHDFVIHPGDSDPSYCYLSAGVGCVVFSGDGSSEQTVNFTVLKDSSFEGNETFYLKIIGPVHMAHPGYPNRLKVTIVDASKPATIGFETTNKVVNESTIWAGVGVVRTGNLRENVSVTCVFKKIAAFRSFEFTGSFNEHGDVVIALDEPEEIKFKPGQNRSICPFGIVDDGIYEKEEQFKIYLETSSIQVVIPDNFSSAVVSVVDPEDIPVVQFTVQNLSATEPRSNYDVDSQTVVATLVRTGDIGLSVTVQYSLINGTAVGCINHMYTNQGGRGNLTFDEGEERKDISVRLMANHQSNECMSFTVLVSEIDTAKSVIIGKNNSVTVLVENTEIVGPILPGKPVVVNEGKDSSLPTNRVYHHSPLYCLMPCLPDYNNMDEDKEGQYHVDCLSINLVRTMFAWEYSLDGEQFHLITATTKITSVNSKTLDPIYFRSGMFVRCSCQPVSRDGIYGHPRISGMVRLESSEWCSKDSSQDDRVRVQLSSYDSFGARNEDLLKISISLPRISNTLPIVLARSPEELNIGALLTENDDGGEQACTSINDFTVRQILPDQTWYSTLNYTSCTWTFSVWTPRSYLEYECNASITLTNSTIAVGIHVVYFNVINQRTQIVSVQSSESQLLYSAGSRQYLPPPLYYLSENSNSENSYIYPIAVEKFSSTIYFYSSSAEFSPLISSNISNNRLTLLHSDKTQRRLAWELSADNLESILDTTIALYEDHKCEIPNCALSVPHKFKLIFRYSQDETLISVLEIDHLVTLIGKSIFSSVFRIGDVLTHIVSLRLAKHQKIQPGFFLTPTKISLLNSTSIIELWKTGDRGTSNNTDTDIQFSSSESDEISFNFISKLKAPIDLMLVVSWALTNANGIQILVQNTEVLVPHPNLTASFTLNETSELHNSLKAAIVIFVMTLIIAMITFAVIGVFVWIWRVQKGLRSKLQQAQVIASQKNHKLRRLSGTVLDRIKASRGTGQEIAICRSHSTTGFPATVEHYNRRKHRKQTMAYVGQGEVTVCVSQPSVHRCRSVPNLSELQLADLPMDGFLIEPRRNLNKVHTRVKKLNSQHTELQKSSSEAQQRLLQAYRVDNLKTSQDITPKQNNYGVNEGKLNTEKKGYRKEFASFAVRSIAASAKTPEPGSSPRTVL